MWLLTGLTNHCPHWWVIASNVNVNRSKQCGCWQVSRTTVLIGESWPAMSVSTEVSSVLADRRYHCPKWSIKSNANVNRRKMCGYSWVYIFIRPQSSQLAEPPWTDPNINNGISVWKLISTPLPPTPPPTPHKSMVEHSPTILASEE